jgi:uncharacterized protein (DUF1697 family)
VTTADTYVALLRGVNVSGRRSIAMAELRRSLEELGLSDVRTYLRSGNVVFRDPAGDAQSIVAAVGERIAADFGETVAVLLLPSAELLSIAGANPFLSVAGVEAGALYVTFLFRPAAAADFAALQLPVRPGEAAALAGRAVYLRAPGGYARSRLSNAFFEKALATSATTRNWRTVTALAEMIADT